MKKLIYFLVFSVLFFIFSPSVHTQTSNQDQCLTVGFWIEDSAYYYFDPAKNPQSHNTFEQWADNQMTAWNKILADSGVKDCFKIAKIVRVRDRELPRGPKENFPTNMPDFNDRTVDIQWGFPYAWLIRQITENPQIFNGTDWGLLHELSHARYLVDEWLLNISLSWDKIEVTDPSGKPIIDSYFKPIVWDIIYVNKSQDLMADSYNHFYSPHSAKALNLIAGQHNAIKYGNFNAPANAGIFLDDLPKENILKITDNKGNPLNGVNIRIFQSVNLPNAGQSAKRIDNIPDIVGITDTNGLISIGSNPFGEIKPDRLNKKISPGLSNGIFILEISFNNQLGYKVMEVSDFNLAYWSGATEKAVYEIKTNLTTLNPSLTPSPTPTPAPTTISTPTSTDTPTSTPATSHPIRILGKHVDENENPLVLSGQKVSIRDATNNGHTSSTSTPDWDFNNLPYSPQDEVTAAEITGYTTSYSICIGCTVQESYNYISGNYVRVYIPPSINNSNNYINIRFKYTKIPSTPTPTSIQLPTPTIFTTIAPTPTATIPNSPTSTIAPTLAPTSTSLPQKKTVVGMMIDGKSVDINQPFANLHLPGTQGEAGRFIVPVVVIYSDGSSKSIGLIFNYSPVSAPTPTPTPITPSTNTSCISFGQNTPATAPCVLNGFSGKCDGNGTCVIENSTVYPTATPPVSQITTAGSKEACDQCIAAQRATGSYDSYLCKDACTINGIPPNPLPKRYLCEPPNASPYFSDDACPTVTQSSPN